MNLNSSPYSRGGGGNKYETEVQTAYFVTFLIAAEIPSIFDKQIVKFKQQAGNLGYKTDDLLLTCKNGKNEISRGLFQIKHDISISAKNDLFQEVIGKFWCDFTNQDLFDPTLDKLFLVKNIFSKDEKKHFKQLLNWAKNKTYDDLQAELKNNKSKSSYFDMLKTCLDKAKGSAVTKDEIYKFLRCFEVLEYDFDDNSSVSKASFLSLIKLSKSKTCTHDSRQIWDILSAFLSNSNSTGGEFDFKNIPSSIKEYFADDFFPNLYRQLQSVKQQNLELIDLIEDKIGDYHVNRDILLNNAIDCLWGNSTLVISGDAGVGKSAIAKDVISQLSSIDYSALLVFKADVLCHGDLKTQLNELIGSLSLTDFFSQLPLVNTHLIYVDGLEKLLEGNASAFRQLLSIVCKSNNLRLVATCRKQDMNLIVRKFFSTQAYIELKVEKLNDLEYENVIKNVSEIKLVSTNVRLNQILRIPKYLDFAFKSIAAGKVDYSTFSEKDFINSLWEAIIENKLFENYDGMPKKRSDTFIQIAVSRAKAMKPFINYSNAHEEALEKLVKDKVVNKAKTIDLYAPAHDILEDWALMKFLDMQFSAASDDESFFNLIGTEPAMKRAFRLWTRDCLQNKGKDKLDFILRVISSNSLNDYWKIESIVALLLSDYCEDFFNDHRQDLSVDNFKLAHKFISLIRTCCRQPANEDGIFTTRLQFRPIGQGWKALCKYLVSEIQVIPAGLIDDVYRFVDDQAILVTRDEIDSDHLCDLAAIASSLYNHFFLKGKSFIESERNIKEGLMFYFQFAGGVKSEVKELLERCVKSQRKRNNGNWKEEIFYERTSEFVLSGLPAVQLYRYFPDEVLELAEKVWKKKKVTSKSEQGMFGYHSLDVADYFGLTHFIGASANSFITPAYWLLKYHPEKTINYITELVKYTTNEYVKSEFPQRDNCLQYELKINSETTIKQWGSEVLWCMYRGTGKVTPYLLQSILMALEKYLLELAESDVEAIPVLHNCLEALLVGSNSCALTSVVASVVQAYPLKCGEIILPIVSVKEFYTWDMYRLVHESQASSINGLEWDRACHLERKFANDRPHRMKYFGGLRGFVSEYCITIREYNMQIFDVIDGFRKMARSDDFVWLKALDEIDVRTWDFGDEVKTKDGVSGIEFKPKYNISISAQVQANFEEGEKIRKLDNAQHELSRAFENKELLSLEKWRDTAKLYDTIDVGAVLSTYHSKGMLAAVGVRDHWSELNDIEQAFCVNTIVEIVNSHISSAYRSDFMGPGCSLYDSQAGLFCYPLFFNKQVYLDNSEPMNEILLHLLIAPFFPNDIHRKHFLSSFADFLWEFNPEIAQWAWNAQLLYSKFDKENPFYFNGQYTEFELEEYNSKRGAFLQSLMERSVSSVQVTATMLEDYPISNIITTIQLIPKTSIPLNAITFLKEITALFITSHSKEEDIEEIGELRVELEQKLSNVILWDINGHGGLILEFVIKCLYSKEVLHSIVKRQNNELFGFFRWIFKKMILTVDRSLNNDDTNILIGNFTRSWQKFEEILSREPFALLSDLLLLNIEWNEDANDWEALNGQEVFFLHLIKKYGVRNIDAVTNLLSHIGDTTLLPDGFDLLYDILEAENRLITFYPFVNHSERLMQRCYDNHLQAILDSRPIFDKFFRTLDLMVNQGSSVAYWIREYIISYNAEKPTVLLT